MISNIHEANKEFLWGQRSTSAEHGCPKIRAERPKKTSLAEDKLDMFVSRALLSGALRTDQDLSYDCSSTHIKKRSVTFPLLYFMFHNTSEQ